MIYWVLRVQHESGRKRAYFGRSERDMLSRLSRLALDGDDPVEDWLFALERPYWAVGNGPIATNRSTIKH